MYIYNVSEKKYFSKEYKDFKLSDDLLYFFHCNSAEVNELQEIFHFDVSTLIDCMNFDETVRMNSFNGYDFISMNYFRLVDTGVVLGEINLYVGKNYIVLVSQEEDTLSDEFIKELHRRVLLLDGVKNLNKLYYCIFDILLNDMSETMEKVEDKINEIDSMISGKIEKSHITYITNMRENAYIIRKQLRPLVYIGDQLIVNENKFISSENMRYFKNVDIRINKLFDFSVSLQEFSNQLLYTYDSRLAMQTNEVVNKLTIITLFFGPLTVITGIYGMNFRSMPELEWYYGYPLALGVMLIISLAIYLLMKCKKWL